MTRSILADAFEHHVWATLPLIDACLELDDEQLATDVPGTYGSILDTMRHLVGADHGTCTLLIGRSRRRRSRRTRCRLAELRP